LPESPAGGCAVFRAPGDLIPDLGLIGASELLLEYLRPCLKAYELSVWMARSPIGDEKLNPQKFMAKKPARKPNAAFMKPVQPNEALAAIVGAKPLPRTELTKKIWVYIKKNGLQDKKVKTQINADEKLGVIFKGKKAVSMFEMTALVSKNLVK
jgi:hypothetical protein